jgi:hypothetical protein
MNIECYLRDKEILAIGGEQVLLSLKIKDCLAHFAKEHILLLKTNKLLNEFIKK